MVFPYLHMPVHLSRAEYYNNYFSNLIFGDFVAYDVFTRCVFVLRFLLQFVNTK